MPRTDLSSPGLSENLVLSAARATSGDSGPIQGWGAADTLRLQLDVTAFAGTSPTLDVVVEDTIDGAGWNTIATFAQKVATGREVVDFSGLFSDTLRVRWTVGGSGGQSFTFSVDCYSE
jgi:hypothetical protein